MFAKKGFFFVTVIVCVFAFTCCGTTPVRAVEKNLPRIGFEESFDTADGWKTRKKSAPLKAVEVKDGTVRFYSHRTAFSSAQELIKKYPEFNEKNVYNNATRLLKKYDVIIDLGTYRYMVLKMDDICAVTKIDVCGAELPVAYTTGIRVYDLKQPSRSWLWKKKVKLSIQIKIGSSGWATFDYIRFVKELTEEEKKGLFPSPVEYKMEKLEAHPYHKLEEMNARAGRTSRIDGEGQLLTYRDTLSGGEIWKMTDQAGDQSFARETRTGSYGSMAWTDEGRYLKVLRGGRGGRNIWDLGEGKWHKTLPDENFPYSPPKYTTGWESRMYPGLVYGYKLDFHGQKKVDFIFYRFDRRSGKEEEFGRFTFDFGKDPGWLCRGLRPGMGDKVIIHIRGTHQGIIVDPDNKDPGKMVQPLTTPVRIEQLNLADNDTAVVIGNSHTYERVKMDLATRKTCLMLIYGGSHCGHPLTYYRGMVLKRDNIKDPYRPGDATSIYTYYKTRLATDYGSTLEDCRWWLVNGNGGDALNQHLLVDGEDCATIMRLNGFNVSYNSWGTRPYSFASPDATKVAWYSDQLGNGDIYYVVARRPDPPQKVWLRKEKTKIKLSWHLPEHSEEVAGYIIYGAGKDDLFKPFNKKLVGKAKWSGELPENITRFAIAAREWSGLESFLSPVVKLKDDSGPDTLHFNVWLGKKSKTARVVFGRGSFGTRSVRYWKATPAETMPATVTWNEVSIPEGRLSVFAHLRPDKQEGEWEWKKLSSGYKIKDNSITVDVPKDVLLDKVIVTNDKRYKPKTYDDRFMAPDAVKNVKAEVAKNGMIKATWDNPDSITLSQVEVHSGTAGEIPF